MSLYAIKAGKFFLGNSPKKSSLCYDNRRGYICMHKTCKKNCLYCTSCTSCTYSLSYFTGEVKRFVCSPCDIQMKTLSISLT